MSLIMLRKRQNAGLSSILMIVCLYFATAFNLANAIPTLSFELPAQTIMQGDSTAVDLVISGLDGKTLNLGRFYFDMSFDSSVLALTSFSFGKMLNNPLNPLTPSVQFLSLSSGLATISETSLRSKSTIQNGQPNSFILGTFEFLGHSIGSSLLALSNITLANENGQSLNFASSTGLINVEGNSVPAPGALILFILGLAGLSLSRRFSR